MASSQGNATNSIFNTDTNNLPVEIIEEIVLSVLDDEFDAVYTTEGKDAYWSKRHSRSFLEGWIDAEHWPRPSKYKFVALRLTNVSTMFYDIVIRTIQLHIKEARAYVPICDSWLIEDRRERGLEVEEANWGVGEAALIDVEKALMFVQRLA